MKGAGENGLEGGRGGGADKVGNRLGECLGVNGRPVIQVDWRNVWE